MAPAPELSVVVAVGRAGLPHVAAWMELAARDAAEVALEVILVHGDLTPLPPASGPVRFLSCPAGTTVPRLRGAGVAAARAPVVALTEAFCRPTPGWARALLDSRQRTGALAIGGPMARTAGNQRDRALTLMEYGRFFGTTAGPVPDLPLTNASYDRARLQEVLGAAAGELAEPDVHPRLRAAGETLWREPAAVMLDAQRCRLGAALRAQYHHGRGYGGGRMHGRPLPARVVRAFAGPLVPFVQLVRIRRAAPGEVRRCLVPLLLLLGAFALGESVGSLCGPGQSAARWI